MERQLPNDSFLYGEVEQILARLHRVKQRDIKAFRARIRHFRNLGVPSLPKVGSGTKIRYGINDLYELFLALELMHCGLNPLTIKHLSNHMRRQLPHNVELALAMPRKKFWLGISLDLFGSELGEKTTFTIIFKPKAELLKTFFGPKAVEEIILIIKFDQRVHRLHQAIDEVVKRNS